ncbi:DnaJ heat shock n-terminal domain-containing protein [Trifolium pratense]|uniref:DnaJ heat shock n-terminal domain-containing protein n=1 Tax=Trifolium pratense TaxID=57577 RepID=A0A2K3NMT9_TRIPR|nr:DnaJ heat shock n-terminal domain-containing protein [Trifolium pratense]
MMLLSNTPFSTCSQCFLLVPGVRCRKTSPLRTLVVELSHPRLQTELVVPFSQELGSIVASSGDPFSNEAVQGSGYCLGLVPIRLRKLIPRGIKPADTAADIKKAYHKAALRHHPDKAGQLLARSEVGDEGHVWKEISQEVHKDADRLFKMIGEAYAVLSDTAKVRSEYDMEENIRKTYKQKLLTDDMDIIGGHMEIHILDGKRLPRQRESMFLSLVTTTPILGPVESDFRRD